MSHVTVHRQGKAYHVPLATVQDVIDLMDATYSINRAELIADLDAMSASEDAKVKAIREMRSRKGMTTDLVRQAFTLNGAQMIVEHVVEPEKHEAIMDTTPDDLVQTALLILGFDMNEESENDGTDKANPRKGDGTSTTRQ
jgi:hypothetical protein